MGDLPEPLLPPDVDLRGLQFMPLDVIRLRDSDLAAMATGDGFRAAVLLWCASWHQVPAASLPNDDRVLAALAGYGRDLKGWRAARKDALHNWVECSDGRLYHPTVAEKALEAWGERLEYREQREKDRQRLAEWRERKKQSRADEGNGDETVSETPAKHVSERVSKRSTEPSRNADETSKTGTGTGTVRKKKPTTTELSDSGREGGGGQDRSGDDGGLCQALAEQVQDVLGVDVSTDRQWWGAPQAVARMRLGGATDAEVLQAAREAKAATIDRGKPPPGPVYVEKIAVRLVADRQAPSVGSTGSRPALSVVGDLQSEVRGLTDPAEIKAAVDRMFPDDPTVL